jgi:hypothetical protein
MSPSYLDNTATGKGAMDFIKRMQPKDWLIAAVAFIAGAIVF